MYFILKFLTGNIEPEKRTHLNLSPFKCDVCKLSFRHKISLIQHKGSKKHLAKINFLTDRDQEKDQISFKDKPSKPLKISKRKAKNINNNNNDFKCDQCSFSTKTKRGLKQHKARYSNLRLTSRFFIVNRFYNKQKQIHSTDKPYKCDICSFETKWKVSLYLHRTKTHKLTLKDS